jgi:hypothetical protein
MPDTTNQDKRDPSDPTDYSSTAAPETRIEAEERQPPISDSRLWPGGSHGSPKDPGMSSLDPDVIIEHDRMSER